MALQLELITGNPAKRKLAPGATLLVGRTDKAQFQVPDDPTLSGAHFELKEEGGTLTVRDAGSRAGTFLQGARVTEPVEARVGDRIQAGQSIFLITSIPSFGSWTLEAEPQGWKELPGEGYREPVEEGPCSNLLFTEEPQDSDQTLADYVAAQKLILRELRPEWQPGEPRPLPYAGAEEAIALDIRVPAEDASAGEVRQLYVRRAKRFGTATLTAADGKLPEARKAFEQALRGAKFEPPPAA
ncbi:MAG: FHA domain-containing protein [Bryobacterales bacterium]|nr:FHA domain-containing protein [Bryobacterales bacterium]